MPRLLILRYEGNPFAIRMSKVMRTLLESGWEIDVLIPLGGLGSTNVSRDMGWDLSDRVGIVEFPAIANRLEALWSRFSGGHLFGTRPMEDRLVGLMASGEYDAVMVKDSQCLRRVFGARDRAGRPDLPVLCDMYENATEQLRDYLLRFGNRRQKLGTRLRLLVPRLTAIERRFLPQCEHLFVVVDEARDYHVTKYGIAPERFSVAHNVEILADLDAIPAPDAPHVPDDVTLISYVGSLGPHRGIDTILAAAEIVADKATTPYQIVIVGARPEIQRQLQAECAAKGLGDSVRIEGYVPHLLAMQWIKRTQIGLVPHADTPFIRTTIPNKLFQYMSAGACCIVTDVGPLGRIPRECECGLVCQAGSAQGLADRILAALDDPVEAQRLGANGRDWAERRYCWEHDGQVYADALGRLARPTASAFDTPPSRG